MKKAFKSLFFVFAFVTIPHISFADFVGCKCYCGKFLRAPCGDEDCKRACGWQEPSAPSSAPSYDYEGERQRQEAERQRLEAERQRQQELEDQRKREEEETKRKQAEFEKSKEEALKSMKGIMEGELGLKGTDAGVLGLKDIGDTSAGGLGLKDAPVSPGPTTAKKPDCEWGNMGSSVVDLRCLGLDPDKPIVIDPHVVRGEERVFPAQIDPATFENANYNKGFEALMRFDAASATAAVEYFKQAQLERPRDPLVRNALLLAQDILKARQQKEKDDQFWSANFTLRGYAALMMGDNEKAKGYIAQARKLDPNNDEVKFVESLAKVDLGPESTHPGRKNAYRFVANSLVSISKRDIPAAISMLEAAQRLQPGDKLIGALLLQMRNYETGRASANTGK